jgi:formate C-acetyltransferase
MTTTASVLTAQEQAIESGKNALYENVSDRVLRMYEAMRAYGSPRVALDRAVLFTESFQETEGQPLVWRWAKALKPTFRTSS